MLARCTKCAIGASANVAEVCPSAAGGNWLGDGDQPASGRIEGCCCSAWRLLSRLAVRKMLIVVLWFPVAGYLRWGRSSAASAIASHTSIIDRLYNVEA